VIHLYAYHSGSLPAILGPPACAGASLPVLLLPAWEGLPFPACLFSLPGGPFSACHHECSLYKCLLYYLC